jgi:hypothetical protein
MYEQIAAGDTDNRHPGREQHFGPGHPEPDDWAVDDPYVLGD